MSGYIKACYFNILKYGLVYKTENGIVYFCGVGDSKYKSDLMKLF